MLRLTPCCGWAAALSLIALPAPTPAETIIYRFGGVDLPPPAEVVEADVTFRQMQWALLSPLRGGAQSHILTDGHIIGPWIYDPATNSAPELWRGTTELRAMFDDRSSTAWEASPYICGRLSGIRCEGPYGPPGVLSIGFVDPVFIERIRLISGGVGQSADPLTVVRNLGISAFPVPQEGDLIPHLPFLVEIRGNQERTLTAEMATELPSAEVQFAFGEHQQPWDITEIEIYARGVAKRASYTSNMLDFGRPGVWGWASRRPGRASSARPSACPRAAEADRPGTARRPPASVSPPGRPTS